MYACYQSQRINLIKVNSLNLFCNVLVLVFLCPLKWDEHGWKWVNVDKSGWIIQCSAEEGNIQGGIQGQIAQRRLQKASEQFAVFWQTIHNNLPPVETRNVRLGLWSMVTMVLPSKISTFNLFSSSLIYAQK